VGPKQLADEKAKSLPDCWVVVTKLREVLQGRSIPLPPSVRATVTLSASMTSLVVEGESPTRHDRLAGRRVLGGSATNPGTSWMTSSSKPPASYFRMRSRISFGQRQATFGSLYSGLVRSTSSANWRLFAAICSISSRT
jgi:hypothetical protein